MMLCVVATVINAYSTLDKVLGCQRVCMHCDVLNGDFLFRPTLCIYCCYFQFLQDRFAIQYSPEDRILPVQMGCWGETDEELAAIGHRALISHTDYAPGVMA